MTAPTAPSASSPFFGFWGRSLVTSRHVWYRISEADQTIVEHTGGGCFVGEAAIKLFACYLVHREHAIAVVGLGVLGLELVLGLDCLSKRPSSKDHRAFARRHGIVEWLLRFFHGSVTTLGSLIPLGLLSRGRSASCI